MRKELHIITILACLLVATVLTGCHLSDLAQAEPDGWERRKFERSVAESVRRAVRTPGIDNGSTIIVTSSGDTLVAPSDSTLLHDNIRTVYIDIESPKYPSGLTNSSMNLIEGVVVTSVIGIFILVIIIGIFVIVVNRQHGRNRLIRRAIDQDYTLPEAFFTGSPMAPDVTVNQIISPESPSAPDTETERQSCPPPPPASGINLGAVKDAVKEVTGMKAASSPLRDLRNGFILVGIGLVVFISFAVGDKPALGFFVGGILAVLGAAKIFTYFFGRKL